MPLKKSKHNPLSFPTKHLDQNATSGDTWGHPAPDKTPASNLGAPSTSCLCSACLCCHFQQHCPMEMFRSFTCKNDGKATRTPLASASPNSRQHLHLRGASRSRRVWRQKHFHQLVARWDLVSPMPYSLCNNTSYPSKNHNDLLERTTWTVRSLLRPACTR